MTAPDPPTEELRAIQADKADAERELAREAERRSQERTHQRRADKAEYLREKLDEQAEALGGEDA